MRDGLLNKKDIEYGTIIAHCKTCPGFNVCRKNLKKYTKSCGYFEKEVDMAFGYAKAHHEARED